MKLWASFVLGFGLVFFGGCSESTSIQPSPKKFKAKKRYQLKVVRVEKKTPQNKSVVDIDIGTLKKIVKRENIKKGSMEYRVLKLLRKINIEESLNLKTINSKARDVKEAKDEFVAIGLEYYESGEDGYILYFDKESLDVKKMVLFKGRNVFDISSDMTKVVLDRVKHGVNYIELYDFTTSKFKNITKKKSKIGYIRFSTRDNYIVVTTLFKTYDKNSAAIEVYNAKEAKSLFRDTAYSTNSRSLNFEFAFSPDERYFFISLAGRGANYRLANLYMTGNFMSVMKFYEKKSKDDRYGWSRFLLTDKYLVFIDKGEIYRLKTKKLTDKVYFGFREPNIVDKKKSNLFYAIGTEKIDIYYIKEGIVYIIKTLSKDEDFTKDAMLYRQKLYLYQAYSDGKFQIIDLPKLNIGRYDFELVKRLKKAKRFYNAGFKAKAIDMYKKLVNNRDFNAYFKLQKYNNYIAIYGVVSLEKYKIYKDLKSLAQYAIYALEYNYTDEALRALNELKKSQDRELYTLVNAIYMVQIGKKQKGYDSLVDSMPFSQKMVDLVEDNADSYLKFYKDKGKISLIFGINKSKIRYQKLKNSVDFVNFNGEFINSETVHSKTEKKKEVSSLKQNSIKLLNQGE